MCLFVCFVGSSDSLQESPAKKKIYKITSDKMDLIKADTANEKIWNEILSSFETITVGYMLMFSLYLY